MSRSHKHAMLRQGGDPDAPSFTMACTPTSTAYNAASLPCVVAYPLGPARLRVSMTGSFLTVQGVLNTLTCLGDQTFLTSPAAIDGNTTINLGAESLLATRSCSV
jgi:hypothetical protein